MTELIHTPSGSTRNAALDVLRGFALFGILVMNIPGYALMSAEYVNPMATGDLNAGDWWAWLLTHVLVEQKFMTLFSLLFGAGIFVAAENHDRHGRSPWSDFWTRTFILLALGLIHAYLIWYGDVLTTYALAGVVAMLMRKRSIRTLILVGAFFLAVPSMYSLLLGVSYDTFPQDIKQELALAWNPSAEAIAREQGAYRSDWLGQMPQRFADAYILQTFMMATLFFWRAAGLMLLGIALLRLGVLGGERSGTFYTRLAAVGIPVGIGVTLVGVLSNESHDWHVSYAMFLGSQFNYWGSFVLALGYLGLLFVLRPMHWMKTITEAFAKAGRATLTMYLAMSVIGTFVFYGHGLGYYDHLSRVSLLAMVPAFWLVELLLLGIWFRFYRIGPLELMMGWIRRRVAGRPQSAPELDTGIKPTAL